MRPFTCRARGYEIGRGYQALVLYAQRERLTLKYTAEDNVVADTHFTWGNICVEPNLVSPLRRPSDSAGRHSPACLRAGQAVGRARSHTDRGRESVTRALLWTCAPHQTGGEPCMARRHDEGLVWTLARCAPTLNWGLVAHSACEAAPVKSSALGQSCRSFAPCSPHRFWCVRHFANCPRALRLCWPHRWNKRSSDPAL